ncbi:hypothetical protein VITU9109_07836, partial [Vibrio tubiashii ATCC 19109]
MNSSLPFLIAGPILRKTTSKELVFWLVTSEPLSGHFELNLEPQLGTLFSQDLSECQQLAIGKHCYLTLAQFKGEFPTNVALSYEFITQHGALTSLYPELLYSDEQSVTFKISTKADYILHGS